MLPSRIGRLVATVAPSRWRCLLGGPQGESCPALMRRYADAFASTQEYRIPRMQTLEERKEQLKNEDLVTNAIKEVHPELLALPVVASAAKAVDETIKSAVSNFEVPKGSIMETIRRLNPELLKIPSVEDAVNRIEEVLGEAPSPDPNQAGGDNEEESEESARRRRRMMELANDRSAPDVSRIGQEEAKDILAQEGSSSWWREKREAEPSIRAELEEAVGFAGKTGDLPFHLHPPRSDEHAVDSRRSLEMTYPSNYPEEDVEEHEDLPSESYSLDREEIAAMKEDVEVEKQPAEEDLWYIGESCRDIAAAEKYGDSQKPRHAHYSAMLRMLIAEDALKMITQMELTKEAVEANTYLFAAPNHSVVKITLQEVLNRLQVVIRAPDFEEESIRRYKDEKTVQKLDEVYNVEKGLSKDEVLDMAAESIVSIAMLQEPFSFGVFHRSVECVNQYLSVKTPRISIFDDSISVIVNMPACDDNLGVRRNPAPADPHSAQSQEAEEHVQKNMQTKKRLYNVCCDTYSRMVLLTFMRRFYIFREDSKEWLAKHIDDIE